MSEANVTIKMIGHGRGEVFINGEKVPSVKSFTVAAGVGAENEVRLTLTPTVIDIEGVFDVSTIKSDVREFKVGNEG